MKHTALALLSLLLLAGVPSYAEDVRPKGIDAKAAQAMARSSNAFALDLYGQLRVGDGNLFFSPYSIHASLMMAREGARAETAAEMDAVLRLAGVERGAGYPALRDSILPRPVQFGRGKDARHVSFYELNIANAVWGQRRYFVKNTFLQPLRDVYGAPLRRVDFDNAAAARRAINRWAARETRNKIRDVMPPGLPRPLTRLLLTNAVYFKACWADEFNVSATKPEIFKGPGGAQRKVPTMWQIESHGYAEMDGLQILELSYLADATSMVLFLPRETDGLAKVEERLCAGTLGDWAASLRGRRVDLKVPRFKFTSRFALAKALGAIGMGRSFDTQKADFKGITEAEGIFLGAVVHKAFVSVDEKGTEAAAVTALEACGADAAPAEPVVFRADHPFVFLIRHRMTGAILFMGRVTSPGG